jgi:hypothetical protein
VSATSDPRVDWITAELWECDGCGFTDRLQAVNEHIVESAYWADGTFKDPDDVVCWSALQVGSDVWCRWHFDGLDPVHGLIAIMRDDIRRHGLDETDEEDTP